MQDKQPEMEALIRLHLESVAGDSVLEMLSAAFTGTVLFSTTIFLPPSSSTVSAIILAANSTYFRSAALPFPTPNVLVGVLTQININ